MSGWKLMGQYSTTDMGQEGRIQTWGPKQVLKKGESTVTFCIWQLPLTALSWYLNFFLHFEVSKVSFELICTEKAQDSPAIGALSGRGTPYFRDY